jgi:hypothetical protein
VPKFSREFDTSNRISTSFTLVDRFSLYYFRLDRFGKYFGHTTIELFEETS